MREEGLVTFFSTHDAIRADNICREHKMKAGLIPLHPDIDAGCGFMMKIEWDKLTDLVTLFQNEKVVYKALYHSQKSGIKRKLTLIYENDKK